MTDENRTKAQLVAELKELRKQVLDLKNKKPLHKETDESRFKELAEMLPEAMFEADADLNVTTVNKRALELFGYSNDDVTKGLNAIEMIVPKDRNRAKQNLTKQLKGEALGVVEYQAVKKDSSTFPAFLRINPIKQEGAITGFRCLIVDITERKKIEDKLRQRESFLNSLIDQNPYPMWISDDRGNLIQINQACCDLLNIRPDEVIGKYNVLQDSIVKEQGFLPLVKSVYKKGDTAKFTIYYDSLTLKHLDLDNSAFVILDVTISPVKDDEGRVTNAIIMHNDITTRKKAEEELQENEMLLRKIAENYPNSYLSIIEKDFTIGFTSGQEFKNQNLDPDDFIGLSLEQIFGDKASIIREYYKKTFKGREQSFELFINDQFQRYRTVPLYAENGSITRILAVVENITERKLAEEKLKESEHKYREIIESSPEGIVSVNKTGKIIAVNKTFIELTGFKESDFLGKGVLKIPTLIKQEASFYAKTLKSILRGKSFDSLEFKWKHASGETRFGDAKVSSLKQDNKIIGFQGIIRDITERKQAETMLREREALLNEVGRIAKIGGWEMDLISRTANWTKGTYDIVEIDYDAPIPGPDEHMGYYLPEFRPMIEKAMTALIKKNVPLEFEAKLLTAKGNVKWCRAIGQAIRENGKCVKLFGTFQDISLEKHSEDKLRDSESRLSLVFNHTTDLQLLVSLDDDGEFRINAVNNAYIEAAISFGINISVENYVGKTLAEAFQLLELGQDVLEYTIKNYKKTVASGEPVKYSETIDLKNGTYYSEITLNPVMDKNGKYKYVLYNSHNITEQSLAENSLRESEEKYRLLFENMMNGFALHEIILNKKGQPVDYLFLEANVAFEQLTKLKRKNIIRKKVTEVLPGIEKDPADWIGKYGKVALTGQDMRFEQYSHPIGKWYSVLAFRARKDQFATIFEDITVRKQAEDALQESERKYRTLVESLPQRIFSKDRDLKFLTCNENFAKDLNTTPEKLIGKTDADFYPKALAEKFQQDDRRVMETGKTEVFEETSLLRGKERIVHTVKTPLLNQQGKTVGILGIFWDITEKKKMEIELRLHRDELEKLVKERTAELEEKNIQLERFNKLFVGREFRVKELKNQVKALKEKLEKL
jgi:PAS domain S-box-containing protein